MKITLERINTSAGWKWAESRFNRLVRIVGDGWYWRPNRCGYTDCICQAGIYTLADALNASSHCGTEKHIVYEFLPDGEGKPTQQDFKEKP